jgi:hypothetical protein
MRDSIRPRQNSLPSLSRPTTPSPLFTSHDADGEALVLQPVAWMPVFGPCRTFSATGSVDLEGQLGRGAETGRA